jgi:aerobic carbon-monoxide dehydrogenase large subunit
MSELHLAAGLERRKEDYGLITGQSRFVDDLRPPNGRPQALYMAVVRSPYAHARIERIRLDAALALPGVVAAFEGSELVNDMRALDYVPLPGLKNTERRPLAIGKVRYVGDPVAVVLADSRYVAMDALEQVEVDYTPLQAVIDPEVALAVDAPMLYEQFGSNLAFTTRLNGGNVEAAFESADRIIHLRLINQRLAPSSIEARVCMFDYDPSSGVLSAWMSSQAIFRARDMLAAFLNLDTDHIRIHNAEVGGAFGAKNALLGEEIIAAKLAIKYERPVKWIEGRSENLQAQTHGRGWVNNIEAAVSNDGRLLGLRVRSIADLGAFNVGVSAMIAQRMPSFLSGPYKLQAVDSEVVGVFTNKVPTAPYRGAGRPEAAYVMERTMDRIALELNIDPVEVRRRNFIPKEAFTYLTVTGVKYDSGNYRDALEKALELVDYTGWRAKQREQRELSSKKLLGIGLSSFIELTGDSFSIPGALRESATVRIRKDGSILVQSGVAHTGQGHYTAFAQIVAKIFDIAGSQVEVCMNDTSVPGFSGGTFGSRVTQIAGSAVLLAAEAVREKAIHVAARELEVDAADLIVEGGQVLVRGVPARSIALGELARLVEGQPRLIEHEPPNPANKATIEGLAAWRDFASQGAAYASGTHVAVVEVDRETGEVHILTYVAVDDCGRVLNHYLAEAQIHGGLAQGIGQALYEEVIYDQDGQLLTSTLMDYSLPLADEVPDFVTDLIETPSPLNPPGVKGVGEAGCIGAPPAIVNAVLDALAPLGIEVIDMPLKPEKVWVAIQNARSLETLRDHAREWVCAHYEYNSKHLLQTEVWLQRLKPDASEEILLAALTHDMERAFPGPDSPSLDPRDGVDNPVYNIAHSERSARILSDYLHEQGASQESIEQVARLIRAHEYGGDSDENLVQAADSLSFLEVNVNIFLGWMDAGDEKWNADAVHAKFTWMYERIQIPQARDLARPMYVEAIRKLESRTR